MQVEVRDHVLWIPHITGEAELKAWLEQIPSGASVRLAVDGVAGDWRKMDDGKDGRPTPGFKPVTEPGRSRWHALQDRRGAFVQFAVEDDD
jgi:hypothetical protein